MKASCGRWLGKVSWFCALAGLLISGRGCRRRAVLATPGKAFPMQIKLREAVDEPVTLRIYLDQIPIGPGSDSGRLSGLKIVPLEMGDAKAVPETVTIEAGKLTADFNLETTAAARGKDIAVIVFIVDPETKAERLAGIDSVVVAGLADSEKPTPATPIPVPATPVPVAVPPAPAPPRAVVRGGSGAGGGGTKPKVKTPIGVGAK